MDVSLLGPFKVIENGVNVAPSVTKPRTLLAFLACGHVTPVDLIVEELWGDDPPRSAANVVQGYILQLRRLLCSARLQPDPKRIIRRESHGYVLERRDGVYDVAEYDRLASAGHRALERGDLEASRHLLLDAQEMWRGSAFEDVRTGSCLTAEATRLEESYDSVTERLIEICLRLGRHHEVLGDLAGLTTEQPSNERLRQHYAIALYRSGQRTRALAECDQLRVHLGENLGLEPSSAMRALRQAIVVDDARLTSGEERVCL